MLLHLLVIVAAVPNPIQFLNGKKKHQLLFHKSHLLRQNDHSLGWNHSTKTPKSNTAIHTITHLHIQGNLTQIQEYNLTCLSSHGCNGIPNSSHSDDPNHYINELQTQSPLSTHFPIIPSLLIKFRRTRIVPLAQSPYKSLTHMAKPHLISSSYS